MKITSSYLFRIAFIFSIFLLGGISLSAQEIVVSGISTEHNSI